LKHHAVGSFDLAITPWMGDQGVVDVNSVILAKIPEDRASESCTEIDDDFVRHTEAMLDVSDEFDCFFCLYFHNRSDFDPLGKLVNGHRYMFLATQGGTKWSYSVETPHSEGP
jgi:hypothetical protein